VRNWAGNQALPVKKAKTLGQKPVPEKKWHGFFSGAVGRGASQACTELADSSSGRLW
jgi:hypothetical protein